MPPSLPVWSKATKSFKESAEFVVPCPTLQGFCALSGLRKVRNWVPGQCGLLPHSRKSELCRSSIEDQSLGEPAMLEIKRKPNSPGGRSTSTPTSTLTEASAASLDDRYSIEQPAINGVATGLTKSVVSRKHPPLIAPPRNEVKDHQTKLPVITGEAQISTPYLFQSSTGPIEGECVFGGDRAEPDPMNKGEFLRNKSGGRLISEVPEPKLFDWRDLRGPGMEQSNIDKPALHFHYRTGHW